MMLKQYGLEGFVILSFIASVALTIAMLTGGASSFLDWLVPGFTASFWWLAACISAHSLIKLARELK